MKQLESGGDLLEKSPPLFPVSWLFQAVSGCFDIQPVDAWMKSASSEV
jgi:hypothetical protein